MQCTNSPYISSGLRNRREFMCNKTRELFAPTLFMWAKQFPYEGFVGAGSTRFKRIVFGSFGGRIVLLALLYDGCNHYRSAFRRDTREGTTQRNGFSYVGNASGQDVRETERGACWCKPTKLNHSTDKCAIPNEIHFAVAENLAECFVCVTVITEHTSNTVSRNGAHNLWVHQL